MLWLHRVPAFAALTGLFSGCALIWGIEDLPGDGGVGGGGTAGSTSSSPQTGGAFGTGAMAGMGGMGAGGTGGAGGSCEAPTVACAAGCVDVTTNAESCGACDHDCGDGAACADGLCSIVEVAVHGGNGARPNFLTTSGGFLVWALPDRIERIATSGGSVETTLNPAYAAGIVVAEGVSAGKTDVVYSVSAGTVQRIEIDGTNPRNVGSGYPLPRELATDGDAVYFATHAFDPDASDIMGQADANTTPIQITARTRQVRGMFAEPGLVFWVEAQTTNGGNGSLMRWTSPNQFMELATFPNGSSKPAAVAANSNFIYVLTEDGSLLRRPKSGQADPSLVFSTFAGSGEIKTPDGQQIYWSDGGGAIYRLDDDANVVKLVATDGHVFAVDATHVYFATDSKIFRVAR